MKPSTIAHDSFVHLREEEEESSESSSAEVGISGAATQAIPSASTMSSVSTNKHTLKANGDPINHTTGSHRKAGNDGKGLDFIREVCLEVFRKTWDEFYEWEREYCEGKLAALMDERRKGARAKATTTVTAETANPSSPPAPVIITLSSDNMLDLSDAFADFDADPKYESCTPLYGNVYVGDDPDVMPFLPFGEEDWDGYPLPGGGRRRFSYERHIKEYGELAWMSEFDDPDLDCILYATTQRLISMSISYEQMDAIGVFARVSRLPLLSASPGDHYDLEARAARRVFPPFPGLPSTPTPRPPAPSILSTFKTHIYPLFCHNLTCIRHICPTHSEDTPYPHPMTPEKKSIELADDGSSPCSPTCFLHSVAEQERRGTMGAPQSASLASWSAQDKDTLITFLELDADARPCDLAVIMKKSCDDIFRFRKRMFPDPMITSRNPGKASLKPSKHGTRDNILVVDHQTYEPPGPCYHAGPCDITCPCVRANTQCERKCLCDDLCPLRKGCKCKPKQGVQGSRAKKVCCRTKRCPCRRAKRACDPEQCAGCAITDSQVPTCFNMTALWAAAGKYRKAVEVRQSAHGYGLFLKESVLADEFLMEYTGEAILEPTCISRDHLIIHRQRNYLFSLHTTLSVDSSLAGDPSRFINHGNPSTSVDGYAGAGEGIANVHSRVEITNGGHGIMIYAAVDMDAGTELLLDYGPKFFKQLHGGDDDGDDDGDGADNEGVAAAEEEEGAEKFTYWDDDPEYGEEQEYRE